ncbi:Eco57I restriction-modification methylase domain-containing protein [Thermocoleostomius sinensis]|uniref:site-specific DNA-methyltransferase (adenine-specific) n=1 Tax=Thermocoleostomius sinensis A174 TaxID=2016057 RepID=A0A9E9C8U2_9CYAN|nr:DNA methyltransferase [Thermocoleostomius sinensis]WAL60663.1 N-6 DNA methylase [Thermocoleostomius sinensis A174]
MNSSWLRPIEAWRQAIVTQLVQQSQASTSESNRIAQHLGLALLWLCGCEHGRILSTGTIEQWQHQSDLYPRLLELLHRTDNRLGISFPFALPTVAIPDELLRRLLNALGKANRQSTLERIGEQLGQLYEHSLSWQAESDHLANQSIAIPSPRITKKNRGIYYTPAIVVDYIVKQTIGRVLAAEPSSNLPSFQILDPACGSGAFLLGAYQYLLNWQLQRYLTVGKSSVLVPDSHGQWQLSIAEHLRLLNYLYGVDIDPAAIGVTRLSLWLMTLTSPDTLDRPLPDLSNQLRCGNALIDADCHDFTWQQAFPTILANGGFEVVIGNPPYLDSEGMTTHLPNWRQACTQQYRSAVGNWDLFCVFIEKAIDLCRSGGFISLVVPNKLASAAYAHPVRQLLTQTTQLLHLRDYAAVPVFAASVYPLVFVAKKGGTSNSSLLYEAMQDLQQVHSSRSINLFASGDMWRFTTPVSQSLLSRLQQTLPALGDIARVQGAATVAEAYEIQSLIQDNSLPTTGDLPVINSGTIDRYQLRWGHKPLRYLGQVYHYPCVAAVHSTKLPTKRYQQATKPKIIVAGLSQQLECAIDRHGSVLAAKSTSIIWQDTETLDLRYLLGLLNSQLLNAYFRHSFGGNRLQGGYYRVGPPQLRSLPIYMPNWDDATDRQQYIRLIALVEQRLSATTTSQFGPLDHAIDRLVYALYRLNEAEIKTVEAIGWEL